MSSTIQRLDLPLTGEPFLLDVPRGTKVLVTGIRPVGPGELGLSVWAEYPNNVLDVEYQTWQLVQTGGKVPDPLSRPVYLGSFLGGPTEFHLYHLKDVKASKADIDNLIAQKAKQIAQAQRAAHNLLN